MLLLFIQINLHLVLTINLWQGGPWHYLILQMRNLSIKMLSNLFRVTGLVRNRAKWQNAYNMHWNSFAFNFLFFGNLFIDFFSPWNTYIKVAIQVMSFLLPLNSFCTFNAINHLYSLHWRILPAKRATLVCLASNGHLARPLISSPSYSKVFN